MKLAAKKREEVSSATLTQTLGLILAFSGLLMAATYASPPAWWTSRGAVNSSLGTNDYLAINESQLKQFTSKAVQEMNTNLADGGGASLNSLIQGWSNDYQTNSYSAANPKPSDLNAIRVGQLKYIGNLVWSRLEAANYTSMSPSWLHTNNAVDSNLANIGQLKSVFDFDLTIVPPQVPVSLTVVLAGTQASLSWSDPSTNVQNYLVQESTDGGTTWATVDTVSGSTTNDTLTGLTLGGTYSFRVIAGGPANSSSQPTANDAAPIINLNTPSGATLVP